MARQDGPHRVKLPSFAETGLVAARLLGTPASPPAPLSTTTPGGESPRLLYVLIIGLSVAVAGLAAVALLKSPRRVVIERTVSAPAHTASAHTAPPRPGPEPMASHAVSHSKDRSLTRPISAERGPGDDVNRHEDRPPRSHTGRSHSRRRALAALPPNSGVARTLDPAAVRRGITPTRAAIRDCGRKHGAPAGTPVAVSLAIVGETGLVARAEPEGDAKGTVLGACVAGAVAKASFPPVRRTVVTVRYTAKL